MLIKEAFKKRLSPSTPSHRSPFDLWEPFTSYLPDLVRTIIAPLQHLKEASTAPTAAASVGSRLRGARRRSSSNNCLWKMAASASRAIYKSNTHSGKTTFMSISTQVAQGKVRCHVQQDVTCMNWYQYFAIQKINRLSSMVPWWWLNFLVKAYCMCNGQFKGRISLTRILRGFSSESHNTCHFTSPCTLHIHAQLPGTLALLLPTVT